MYFYKDLKDRIYPTFLLFVHILEEIPKISFYKKRLTVAQASFLFGSF